MKDQLRTALRKFGALGLVFRWHEMIRSLNVRTLRQNAKYWGKPAPDGLPVPPPFLMVKVTGTASKEWFFAGGQAAERSVRRALEAAGKRVEGMRSILDFGCGSGRVIRRWHALPSTRVCGTDYNPTLIDWCRKKLPFAEFNVNELSPPLRYADGEFEFVYALSVFTHLTEELQERWIRELRRIISPGGFLLITTHGDYYLNQLTPAERSRFEANQLVMRYEETAGMNIAASFSSEAWVRRHLIDGFEVASFIPTGAEGNPHQDLYLLKKK